MVIRDTTGGADRATVASTLALNWEWLTVSWLNNTGAPATCTIRCRNAYGDNATNCWFDAVQLENRESASAYCDGTQPNCYWSGVAHNSTSGRTAYLRTETYHEELSVGRFADEVYELRDIGGFYSCQFKVVKPSKEWAIEFLNNGVGRHIEFHGDKSQLVWEGFVNTVEMKVGAATMRCSLTDMTNRTWCRYQPLSGGAVARSANQEHLVSQGRFGIKEEVLNAGQVSAVEANQRAQAYLRQYYWPTPELEGIRTGQMAEGVDITVHGLGYWHTLGWRTYNQTVATGTDNAAAIVLAVVAACGQFVKSTEYDGNGTSVTKVYDADRRAKDIIESICDMGDPEYNLFVAGMEADRHFYYRQAAPSRRVAA